MFDKAALAITFVLAIAAILRVYTLALHYATSYKWTYDWMRIEQGDGIIVTRYYPNGSHTTLFNATPRRVHTYRILPNATLVEVAPQSRPAVEAYRKA